jgi:hypothetical protein
MLVSGGVSIDRTRFFDVPRCQRCPGLTRFAWVWAEVYGLPGSTGTFCDCYWRFVRNNHQLLSIFLADKDHPFSRGERLTVTFAYLAWAFMIACVITPNRGETRDVSTVWHFHQSSCLMTLSVFVLQTPWFVVSFLTALLTVPYIMLLKSVAECGCVQRYRNCCKWWAN